jgi:GntR family transcriptional regulator/MocR family aminotransferase
MDLHVSLAGPGDRADRIYRQLLDAILDGRLRAGERLPPTREFARRLSVSRNTVTAAYDRLTADGFLVSRVGAGTFVCNEPVNRYRSRTAPRGGIRPRPLWRSIELGDADRTTPRYDFRVGVPDPRLFPLQTWRRLVARELRPETTELAASPDPAGDAGLRAAIARYVGASRSVRAAPDDVLITQGAQQALDLIGRVLIEPGACVAVEEPGYQHARLLFCSLGARVVGVPVDAEGIDVAAIPAAARLVYTTPSHQFPLGTPMSLARRAALLEWAERHRAAIIEDDYDTEFRFSDRPLEPLQSLDRGGHVLYVGSFSKTMLPMLRVGFLVAPASLQPALSTAKQLADRHGESPTQAALARFIDDGHLARHVRVATRRYAARHDQIAGTLASDFARWLDVVPSSAGLHLCARVAAGVTLDVEAVVARARLAGIKVESLASFCAESPAQPGLVIGYGAIEAQRIGPGLRRLGAVVGSLAA